ncbi:MAG: cytochrome c3 family protein [Anaerolineae bacterium]|nr:cytochrome c3 family protein [Anaerolineae bacterium]
MKRRNTWVIVGVAAVIIAIAGVALWDYHEQPQFCAALCHVMDPYLASWNGSDFQVQAHAEVDVLCLDCHEPTIEQQAQEAYKFVTGQFEEPLVARTFSDEFCLQCHEHGSYTELIERTKDYTVEDEMINPHDPHPGIEERLVKQLECSNCHKMHRESPAINYCYEECHHDYTLAGCDGEDCH